MSRPGVFLDRDGVLNAVTLAGGVPRPPANAASLRVLPGVAEALSMLEVRGLPRIVVTNQPDVARGGQTRQAVEAINDRLRSELPLSAIYVCYHDSSDACECRKPRPGMLLAAARDHDINLGLSFMIGDRAGDVLAGQAAGCRAFLVRSPYTPLGSCQPDFEVNDLFEAARTIAALVDGGAR